MPEIALNYVKNGHWKKGMLSMVKEIYDSYLKMFKQKADNFIRKIYY